MPLQTLLISDLVPSEPCLERPVVDMNLTILQRGEALPPPTVVIIDSNYYVSDGCHRVMASKEFGSDSLVCNVKGHHEAKPSVSDFNTDMCREAIRKGRKGFNNIKFVATNQEKLDCYDEDDDSLGDALQNISDN